jgi:hypothetical protein
MCLLSGGLNNFDVKACRRPGLWKDLQGLKPPKGVTLPEHPAEAHQR